MPQSNMQKMVRKSLLASMPLIGEGIVALPGVRLEGFFLSLHFDSHLKDVSVRCLIVCIYLKFLGFLHDNSFRKHQS